MFNKLSQSKWAGKPLAAVFLITTIVGIYLSFKTVNTLGAPARKTGILIFPIPLASYLILLKRYSDVFTFGMMKEFLDEREKAIRLSVFEVSSRIMAIALSIGVACIMLVNGFAGDTDYTILKLSHVGAFGFLMVIYLITGFPSVVAAFQNVPPSLVRREISLEKLKKIKEDKDRLKSGMSD